MGASDRQMLKGGMWPEMEAELRLIATRLNSCISDIYGGAMEEDQTDNAADTGALAEKLSIARRFILEELPDPEPESAHLDEGRGL